MNIFIKTVLLTLTLTTLQADEPYQPDIAKGAEVWADVCMRCHNLRQPADLSSRAWKYSMNHMRIRAGLTGEESQDILAFILQSKSDIDAQ